MKINWKVRFKNKWFWLAIIPAILTAGQAVARLAGFDIDVSELSGKLTEVVEAVFVVLAIIGIVNDPTTAGISDSQQAMTYEKPKEE